MRGGGDSAKRTRTRASGQRPGRRPTLSSPQGVRSPLARGGGSLLPHRLDRQRPSVDRHVERQGHGWGGAEKAKGGSDVAARRTCCCTRRRGLRGGGCLYRHRVVRSLRPVALRDSATSVVAEWRGRDTCRGVSATGAGTVALAGTALVTLHRSVRVSLLHHLCLIPSLVPPTVLLTLGWNERRCLSCTGN